MQLPIYVVDAFTTRRFHGNPAAVCLLEAWLPETLMQNIAAENNLAETAFLVPQGEAWGLRWFTPLVEVDLCGHATLASAWVLARAQPQRTEFRFHTRSSELTVTRQAELFTLDFPARELETISPPATLQPALGVSCAAVTRAGKTWIAELADATEVQGCKPDFAGIAALECSALIITAPGSDCDFVSRFFAPKVGINEDAVTGSAHCGLVPYWSTRLGKTVLHARQLSQRGGELFCELRGDRVLMGGRAVLYSQGTIFTDTD